jgi:hypothetical protein
MPGRKRIKYCVPKVKLVAFRSRSQRPTTSSVPLLVARDPNGSMPASISDGLGLGDVYGSGSGASLVIDGDCVSPVTEVGYYQRKQKEVSDWVSIRNDLFLAEVTRNIPCGSTCTQCGQVVEKPIRCIDCGPFVVLCDPCEVKQHVEKHLLHKPEIWEVSVVSCSCSCPLPEG